ncbi:MAG: hypothetical protein JXB39_14515 [Deltaproteobacteria bacterium]|nr:hypothetical protein [Deltaproteobacteria bacterium]
MKHRWGLILLLNSALLAGGCGLEPTCTPVLDGDAAEDDLLSSPTLLVVAPDGLAPAWEPFVDWKRALGVPTVLETLAEAVDGQQGADDAARLRARLAEAASGEGTVAVLLAGDVPDIPSRQVSTYFALDVEGGNETRFFASDLYFADLGSDWDADGDGAWAEEEDAPDLQPDVAVGRVPAGSADEVEDWIAKTLAYEQASDPSWLDQAMLMGELVRQYGSTKFYSSGALETLVLPLFPDDAEVTRLYEDWERYDGALPNDAATQRAQLEAGQTLTLDFGHGTTWGLGNLSVDDLWDLPATGRPGVYTTVECQACAFDASAPVHVACEAWVLAPGGGMAFLGNTDIGIGFPTLTEFYVDLYTALFEDDPSLSLGALVRGAQAAAFDPAALLVEGSLDRFAALTMVLVGDPTLVPWRAVPREPEVAGPDPYLAQDGADAACVEATLDGRALDGATVAFHGDGAFLRIAITDAGGRACAVLPDDPGPWSVTVSGAGLVPVTLDGGGQVE